MGANWRWKWSGAVLCALAVHAGAAADEPRLIRMTSAAWPPYTGEGLREQGATTAVIRAALRAMGYELVVDFFPWRRAIAMVEHGERYAAYFPEYESQPANPSFTLSHPVGEGPLGFAERKMAPVQWQRIEELGYIKLGVVHGYTNTDELDRRIHAGLQPVDEARDDAQNLLKLAAGRVRLAVIDRRVFDYMTRTDPKIAPFAAELRFNPHLLENKRLYVAFRKTPAGDEARRILNEGLKKIDVKAVMDAALR